MPEIEEPYHVNTVQPLWISRRDDSGAHPITINGTDAFPRWSPNGQERAFHRQVDDNVDSHLMNVDGRIVFRREGLEVG